MAQRLSFNERARVEAMTSAGVSVATAARCLGRHRSTIHREPRGDDLRRQRTQRGLTIDAAAQALSTHTTRISALERGHNRDLAQRYQQHLTQIAS